MKKTGILALSILLSAFASIAPAHAHCPLCTAATGAGLVTARVYGVDDSITGLWIGAVIISTTLWFDRMLKDKYAIRFRSAILSGLALALTAIPFYFAGLFSNPVKVFGMDRLLFGIILGSAITFGGTELSIMVKNRRGRVLFPYQTIIFILSFLAATSGIFWYLIRNTGVLG